MTCYAETDCSRPPYHHHRTLRITLINSAKFHAFSLLLHPFFLTTSYSSEKELPQFLYPKKVWDKNNKQNPILKKKRNNQAKAKWQEKVWIIKKLFVTSCILSMPTIMCNWSWNVSTDCQLHIDNSSDDSLHFRNELTILVTIPLQFRNECCLL